MDPRIAARRRRVQESRARRNIRRLLIFMGVAGIIALGYWVFRSPLLDVDQIDISGVDQAPVSDVLALEGVDRGTALIDVDVSAVEAALEQNPWVDDAVVARSWSGTVTIDVTERVPLAWIETGDGGAVAAVDATILSLDGTSAAGLPIIEAMDRSIGDLDTDQVVADTLTFVDGLAPQVLVSTHLTVTGDQVEGLIAGFIVRIGLPTDPAAKAQAVMAVLDTAPEPGSIVTVLAADRPAVLPPGSGE